MSQYSQGLLDAALDLIKRGTQGAPFASRADLARAAAVSEANLSRWLSGASTPTLKKLEPVLEALGARLVLPDGNGVYAPPPDIRLSFSAGSGLPAAEERIPAANDYVLIPLLGEVGCGMALPARRKEPDRWIPLPRTLVGPEVWAVRVRKEDLSMLPRIHPGDIVVVDTRRIGDIKPENIYLVRHPACEGAGVELRRAREAVVHGKPMIMFYADNAAGGYAPQLFDLGLYSGGALREAVKGRVIMIISSVGVR